MHLYVYGDRHVVVCENEAPSEGSVTVKRVTLLDGVSGAARRGRHPNFSQPVPVNKLTKLEDASEELLEKAKKVLENPEA